MTSSIPRKHVTGGYCLEREGSGIGNSFCALEAGQCDEEQQLFRSAKEAQTAGFFRSCVAQSAVREDVFVGHCVLNDSSTEVCAVDEASCSRGGGTFVPASVGNMREGCNIEAAIFGTCDGACVWSIDACETGDYRLPTQGGSSGNKNCTCDRVRVGGCKTPGAPVLCAVGPAACDATQTYRTPDEVVAEEGWECYLCRPPPSPQPASAPTVAPTTTALVPIPSTAGNASSSLLVGAIVAGVVGGLVIGGGVLFVFFRGRRKPPTETAPAAMVDTERGREIAVSEIEDVEDDENLAAPGDAAAEAVQ